MARDNQGKSIRRQWRLLYLLHGLRRGLTVRALVDELSVARQTVYRYFEILEEAGFVFDTEKRNGEAAYRLLGGPLPGVSPRGLQAHALRIARRLLSPLEGTRIVSEIDDLLPRNRAARGAVTVEVAPAPPSRPGILAAIERAMLGGLRLAFTYAPANGAAGDRTVEPLAFYMRDDQPYLNAVDIAKGQLRTFKIARMSDARVTDERAEPHPEHEEARVFDHAAKIWQGPLVDVTVRISPRGARFVSEWPLIPSQEIEPQPDGAVIVRARVSGTVEAMRWVLRWGGDAQALEPPELRAAVVSEHLRAIEAYTGELSRTVETSAPRTTDHSAHD